MRDHRKTIYLASPYSHSDPEVRMRRFRAACTVAGGLMRKGYRVFSPIAHSHPVSMFSGMQGDTIEGMSAHDFWLRQDTWVLDFCDYVVVAKIDGWEKSKGIAEEIERAKERNIPVYYVRVPS